MKKNVFMLGLSVLAGSALAQPAATDLGTLPAGLTTRTDPLAAAGTLWYKAVLPATDDLANPRYVDLTTNGSALGDTVLFVYDNAGNFIAGDDDSGLGFLSFLAFGFGGGTGMGSPAALSDGFDGQHPAGQYYIAVIEWGNGDWNFNNTNWDVIVDPVGAAGDVTLSIEIGTSTLPTPPVATDLGVMGGNRVVTIPAHAAGQVNWHKFTLAVPVNQVSGNWFDINTIGSVTTGGTAGDNDTEIGLYNAGGVIKGANDDMDGTVNRESALTFGANAARTHDATTFVYDGSDGALAAGVYYLASGTYNVAYGAAFGATTTSAASGSITLNFFSNIPSSCSPADVGMQGGIAGQDRLLNNDDFVVFINLFFTSAPAADVGMQGGQPGADQQWNNDDFVVFINYFFNDQAACTG